MKDVSKRYSAMEALNHPWIQNTAIHSDESISVQAISSMESTVELLKLRKAVLSYFCQTVSSDNLVLLRDCLQRQDPQKTGKLSHAEF